jgi:hypothetical protein
VTYAYMCEACKHEASRHRLVKGGDIKAGPYRCQRCECEIPQDAPMYTLSQRQYEIYRHGWAIRGQL